MTSSPENQNPPEPSIDNDDYIWDPEVTVDDAIAAAQMSVEELEAFRFARGRGLCGNVALIKVALQEHALIESGQPEIAEKLPAVNKFARLEVPAIVAEMARRRIVRERHRTTED